MINKMLVVLIFFNKRINAFNPLKSIDSVTFFSYLVMQVYNPSLRKVN